jgi:hypothetical protein
MEKQEVYKKIKDFYEVVVYSNSTEIDFENNTTIPSRPKWTSEFHSRNSQEMFVEHFANKMAKVEHEKVTVVIEKTEEKISLKMFFNYKQRSPGKHWFRRTRSMQFITLNTRTGLLYTGHIGKLGNKKKIKTIHTNKFWGDISSVFESAAHAISNSHNETKGIESELLYTFVKEIPDWKYFEPGNVPKLTGQQFYEYYLTKKGVKIPDNFKIFKTYNLIPPTKLFRKVKNKFIDAVMLYNDISGDAVRKILHEVNKSVPTIAIYKFIVSIVGKDRLHQRPDLVRKFLTYDGTDYHFAKDYSQGMSDQEKANAFKCLISSDIHVRTLRDHALFLNYLKEKELNYVWKAKNENDFVLEHKLFSDEYDRLKHGITDRIYPEVYQDYFKEGLKVGDLKYGVYLLDSQYSYYHESDYQQNCVKTYIQKPDAFIFSVRQGKERATVEYNIAASADEWFVDRVQFLGRFNKKLDENWEEVLSLLDDRVKELLYEHGYKTSLRKVRGDVEKIIEMDWMENGRPIWKNNLEISDDIDYLF